MLHFRVRLTYNCEDAEAYGDAGRHVFDQFMDVLTKAFSSPLIALDAIKKEVVVGASVVAENSKRALEELELLVSTGKALGTIPYTLTLKRSSAVQFTPIAQ